MTKKIKIPTSNTGYGYCGEWSDGKIGWFMPTHIMGALDIKYPCSNYNDYSAKYLNGERSFLCKVTVTPIVNKKGRPITKIHRSETRL